MIKKICICEDDRLIALDIQKILESNGYMIMGITDNGADLYDQVRTMQPDCIILDVLINGDLNGYQIAKKILLKSKTNIVFVTAFEIDEFNKLFSDNPDIAIIQKPYTNATLLSSLRSFEKESA